MILSFRALVCSAAMALASAPALTQWVYEWGFQSISPADNYATRCHFMPDGSLLLAGGSGDPMTLGGITWNFPSGFAPTGGYLARLDAAGVVQWAHFIDQPFNTSTPFTAPVAIGSDDLDNIFIGGQFKDSLHWDGVLVLTDTVNDNVPGAIYVAKVDPTGALLWSRALSIDKLRFSDLAVDGTDDVIVTGYTIALNAKGHLFKLSGMDGSLVFDQVTDPGLAILSGVGTDAVGNILVQGWTYDPFTLGGGPVCPYNNALGGNAASLFVGKLDPNGIALWYHVPDQGVAPIFGHYYDDAILAVAPDGTTGTIVSKAVRIGNDTIADGQGPLNGAYVLDPDGAVLWSRSINTIGWVWAGDCAFDGEGELLVAGELRDGPVDIADTVVATSAGLDAWVMRFDTAGAMSGLMVGPQLLAGVGGGVVTGLAIDDLGKPALCGTFFNTDPVFGPDTLVGFATSFLARLVEAPIATGSIALSADLPLKVFPNPADRAIVMHLGVAREAEVVVYDAPGSEVWSGRISFSSERLDVSNWPEGMYHIRFVHEARSFQARFIVPH